MPEQAQDTMIYTRSDGVRAIQMLYLRQVETALAMAEDHGLEDDPWISRLYECRDLVQATLGQEPHPARRRGDVRPSAEPLGVLRLVNPN